MVKEDIAMAGDDLADEVERGWGGNDTRNLLHGADPFGERAIPADAALGGETG